MTPASNILANTNHLNIALVLKRHTDTHCAPYPPCPVTHRVLSLSVASLHRWWRSPLGHWRADPLPTGPRSVTPRVPPCVTPRHGQSHMTGRDWARALLPLTQLPPAAGPPPPPPRPRRGAGRRGASSACWVRGASHNRHCILYYTIPCYIGTRRANPPKHRAPLG